MYFSEIFLDLVKFYSPFRNILKPHLVSNSHSNLVILMAILTKIRQKIEHLFFVGVNYVDILRGPHQAGGPGIVPHVPLWKRLSIAIL